MSSDGTKIDPLMGLIAEQAALEVQIDRLIGQRATPTPSMRNEFTLVFASISASSSIQIPALNRLGN